MESLHKSRMTASAAVTALAAALTACGSNGQDEAGTFYGSELDLGTGKVTSYVVTGEDGTPIELGFEFEAAALEGLPGPEAVDPHGPPPASVPLDFPDEADGVVVEHGTFDFAPAGHPPAGLFDTPHFDVHFYFIDADEVAAIDDEDPDFAEKASNMPSAEYLPEDYGIPPGLPATELAVPQMGTHLFDLSEPMMPGEYEFDEVLINGVWDGRYIFIEPMVTVDYLLTKPNVTRDLKLPEAYQQSGLYPTKYGISYDAETDTYRISISDLVERTAE